MSLRCPCGRDAWHASRDRDHFMVGTRPGAVKVRRTHCVAGRPWLVTVRTPFGATSSYHATRDEAEGASS